MQTPKTHSGQGRLLQASVVVLALVAPFAMLLRAQDPSGRRQPEISGVAQGNTGCAVLEKHTPVKGKLLAVGVIYARTQYVVLDSVNCKLPKDKYTGPGDVKDLNQYATSNKIKLVVVPGNYTDDELAQAKQICREKPLSPTAVPPPVSP
jgi:hypothetical protein